MSAAVLHIPRLATAEHVGEGEALPRRCRGLRPMTENRSTTGDHRMHPDKIAAVAARAAHEVNNVYNAAIGDPLSPAWDDLTCAQRNGVIAGAKHALAGGSPEDSHNLWLESRRAEGWTYGPVKDFAAKTSPCFLPYAELPEAQRRKDAQFQSVVRAVAEALR